MSKNDITGDSIRSRTLSEEGRANWDAIFGKKTLDEVKEELERECCGTFHGSPHRKTCEKWRGKKPVEKSCTNCGTHCDYHTARKCTDISDLWTPKEP